MLAKSRLNSVCFEFDFSRSKLNLCCVSIYLVCHLLSIQEVEEKETGTTTAESDTAKILELLKNPETAALLKQIVSAL